MKAPAAWKGNCSNIRGFSAFLVGLQSSKDGAQVGRYGAVEALQSEHECSVRLNGRQAL